MCLVGIFAGEHVGVEVGVGGAGAVTFGMGLVAGGKLGFVGVDAAVGAS